jgi:hypothetical protein
LGAPKGISRPGQSKLDELAGGFATPSASNSLQRKEVAEGEIRGPQDWTRHDREPNSSRWQGACLFNLKAADSSQYVKVVERRDFYKWFYEYSVSLGYNTRWALAAHLVPHVSGFGRFRSPRRAESEACGVSATGGLMIDHISLSVLEAVAAPLNVGVPLNVAALGSLIGCVDVGDAVDDQGAERGARLTAWITATITRAITSTAPPEEAPLGASTTCLAGRPERKPMKPLNYCCMS